MKKNTIIVTGGAGFIGSNLVKFLLKKKYFVINVDKLSYSANPYNLKNLYPPPLPKNVFYNHPYYYNISNHSPTKISQNHK